MTRRAAHLAALTLALSSGARPGAAGEAGPASPAVPVCASFLPPPAADGHPTFRDLLVVSPKGAARPRTLSLAIRAEGPSRGRFSDGIAIGELKVRGVPGYVVTPNGAARVLARDPATGRVAAMPTACLADPAFAYGGMVWALRQGDTLDFKVTSALDFDRGDAPVPAAGGTSCRGANLHTHGLGVSSYKRTVDGAAQYGDYAFDFATPDGPGGSDPCGPPSPKAMHMTSGGMAPMIAAPGGTMHVVSRLADAKARGPGGQPSGLFWYHPHTHGYAGVLTAGATSGVISIGGLDDYACLRSPSGACLTTDPVRVRYLLLKDAELAPGKAGWALEHDRDYPLEDSCTGGQGRKAVDREGLCNDWRGHRWVFTVNGVRDPRIVDVRPSLPEVWRIVNGSPNVTYLLSVRPLGVDDPSSALPLAVLSNEGASPQGSQDTTPGTTRALLMMPGSRAEVAVTPPPSGGRYALQQLGFTTVGDVWPALRLAEIDFPGGPPAQAALALRRSQASAPVAERFVQQGSAPGCGFGPEAVRRIYFVQRPSFSDDRRKPTLYGLLAGVQNKGGGEVTMTDASGRSAPLTPALWRALLAGDRLAPAAMHNPLGAVCTYLGHTETWILENDTNEDHNFHIHQSEFQLALDRLMTLKRSHPNLMRGATKSSPLRTPRSRRRTVGAEKARRPCSTTTPFRFPMATAWVAAAATDRR